MNYGACLKANRMVESHFLISILFYFQFKDYAQSMLKRSKFKINLEGMMKKVTLDLHKKRCNKLALNSGHFT